VTNTNKISSKEIIKISIITPAFNEAGYIEQCIESVVRQSWPHFEMIVVDDGSTDNTADIVENYSAADARINLIRMPENVGLTMAKNVALEKATGDYLLFLDADDYILREMISDLIERINEYGRIDMFRLKGRKVYSRDEEPLPGDDYETRIYTPTDLIRENKAGGYMQNLFVKRSIVEENRIRFTEGMIMIEDQEFTMKCMVYSKYVLYFTKQNYMYYQHPGSLSKNFRKEHFPDILNCAARVYQSAKNNLQDDELKVYQNYAYQKAIQYLKAVMKDREVPAAEIRSNMANFMSRVDFQWSSRTWLSMISGGIALSKMLTVR